MQKNKQITVWGDKLIYKATLKKEKYLRYGWCLASDTKHVRHARGNLKDMQKQARRNNSIVKQ